MRRPVFCTLADLQGFVPLKKRLTFREWLDEERGKLSRMTFSAGIRYIWQYYWIFIVGFIGLIWLIVYAVTHFLSGTPEYRIYAVFANSTAVSRSFSQMQEDFSVFGGFDPDEKRIEFSGNMYFDYNRNQARGNEYYESFVALTDSGTLDLITMFPEQLAPLGQSGRLLDWDLERCAELREKYADRLIWYQPPEGEEDTEPVPVGIDISDSLLVSKYGIYPERAALGIGAGTTRLDAIEKFLEFIFDE